MKILFTGGGTGGHISPILAITEELKARYEAENLDLYYIGVPENYAAALANNGIKVSAVLSSKLRRYFDVLNFVDILIFLPISIIQSLWKIFWLMPDVLFSKGGPGSLPVVLACKFFAVPIIIHESDSDIGLANKMAIAFANRIAISFPSAADSLIEKGNKEKMLKKIALLGNPIRRSLTVDVLETKAAKAIFGFDPEKPVIFIIGGSQGAVRINNFMMEIAQEIIADFQIIHQTGQKNFNDVKSELDLILKGYSETEKNRYKILAYLDKDLKDAYAAANLVISRAGSNSIFEIAAFEKPSVLIPIPENVVGPHQIRNAYAYAKDGAALIIEENNLKPNIFLSQLKKLFGEPEKLKLMSEAAKKFSRPDAAGVIAEEIVKFGGTIK
jgi:UDP-N-acetylglucosamine--N-acetylmuramyl-(pentapeptide) pyrophosphoryl-undecaprenol N-acetylglucosamine transferase